MKEVILHIGKDGRVKIMAEGAKGKGTETFTEKLAKALGEIEERHKGHHHNHDSHHHHEQQKQG